MTGHDPFRGWTHGLHVGAGALGQYRRGSYFGPLDPLAGFGRSSIRGYVELGTELSKTRRLTRITVRQFGTQMTPQLPSQFTEIALLMRHHGFRIESRYAHRRQAFASGRINLLPTLVLHSAFLHQEKPVAPNRLWVPTHNRSRPTLRHGFEWSQRAYAIRRSLASRGPFYLQPLPYAWMHNRAVNVFDLSQMYSIKTRQCPIGHAESYLDVVSRQPKHRRPHNDELFQWERTFKR